METVMKRVTLYSGFLLLGTIIWYLAYPDKLIMSLIITLLVVFYQFGMRLIIGNWFEKWFRFSPNTSWFKVGPREQRFYQWLRVKKWKKYLPTYSPLKYDVRQQPLGVIVKTMINAEVDHELMFIGSYLPLLLILPFGDPEIFILTSVAASLIELLFIILQRYNRPRLSRLIALRKKQEAKMDSK